MLTDDDSKIYNDVIITPKMSLDLHRSHCVKGLCPYVLLLT